MFKKSYISYTVIIILVIAIVLVSIIIKIIFPLTCCNYKDSYKLDSCLYVERYYTFCAGVFGEVITCYLTDSTSFRAKIGSSDEHGFLSIVKKSNYIMTYNIESHIETDTLNRICLTKSEIINKSTIDKETDTLKPLFGADKKLCNNLSHFYDYEINDKFYISEFQYHCNDKWLNAVYFTDSSSFKVLIGFEEPGESIHYYCTPRNDYEFDFFETYSRTELDTINKAKFSISSLKQNGFENACD